MTRAARERRSAATAAREQQVLGSLCDCLGQTARAVAAGPPSERARTALARLEEARQAVLPLLDDPDRGARDTTARRATLLPPDHSAARLARAFCRSAGAAWSLPSPAADAAVDVASELVTNATRVARAPVELALELVDGDLVVSVWDDGPGRPHLVPSRPGPSDRGLGLHWVGALSASWGSTDEGTGKRVWAVLRLAPASG